MPRTKTRITLQLPPEVVLRGFIADLCVLRDHEHGYQHHGSSECDKAREYYERVGHPWLHKPVGR